MSEENISIFRQELERVKTQFEDKFQDIMASVRADRENDKRTLQMVNENINNDKKAINQNRALNDKLETLLNVQNNMLSELRSMNNSIKDLSGGGGGMGLLGGIAAGLGGAVIPSIFSGNGDTNVDVGGGNDPLRNTGGGNGTRNTPYTTGAAGTLPERLVSTGQSIDSSLLGSATFNVNGEEVTMGGLELLARTLETEAGSLNYDAMVNAGQVMLNRTLAKNALGENAFGSTIAETVTQPGAFSPWNSVTGYAGGAQGRSDILTLTPSEEAMAAALAIVSGKNPDGTPTINRVGDAVNFFSESGQRAAGAPFPSWYDPNKFFSPEGDLHSYGTPKGERYSIDREGLYQPIEETPTRISETQERDTRIPSSVSEKVKQLEEETGLQVTPLQLEDGTYTFITSRPISEEKDGVTDFTRSAKDIFDQFGEQGFLTKEEDLARERAIGTTIQTTSRYSKGRPFPGINSINEEIANVDWNAIDENETVAIEGKRYFIGDPDENGKRIIYYTGRGGFSAQGRGTEIGGTPIAAIDANGNLIETSGSPHFAGYEDYSHADMSVVLERGFRPSSSDVVEETQQLPTEDKSVEEDEELITPGPDDVVVRRFRSGMEWYKRPDGSLYLLQFGRIRREIPANDAELLTDGGGDDTLGPQNDVAGSRRERIRRDQTFQTLADQFMSGESPTSMDLAPAVEDALRPDLPEPPTEEDSGETQRETTSGGYTGGGGGSSEQEQPEIESNAIGRFPWAEKIIKYYNLSNMIKTNMLS